MSDQTIPARPVTPPHPPWFAPAQCRTTESDVCHSSEWRELDVADGRFSFNLARSDELAHPEEWGHLPELALCVQMSGSPITEATQVYLAVGEIPALVDALLAEYYRATQATETERGAE